MPAVFTSYWSIFFVFIPNILTNCGTSGVCTEKEPTPGDPIVKVKLPLEVPLEVTSYTWGSPATPKPARLLTSPGLSVKYSSSVPAWLTRNNCSGWPSCVNPVPPFCGVIVGKSVRVKFW